MSATVAGNENIAPEAVHNCPSCGHWLTEGTLACPDCHTLAYGAHLSQIAGQAQQLEQAQKWAEARARWQATLPWLPEDTRQAASIREHIAQIDRRLAAEDATKAKWTKRLGPFAPIALFLLKAKSWLFLLFKAKFLLSFLAYFGIYWAIFGWAFAVALVLTVGLHEMGHYIAVKRRGLPVDLPVFLPGFGAYVRWYGQGVSREDLGIIALAGPMMGLAVALIAYAIFFFTHSPFFHLMAYLGAWINLFNLFPVAFFFAFDGAQAVVALSRMQRILVAATFLLFFGLTVSMNPGGDPGGPNTHWIFLILGLGMGWRTLGRDGADEESSGKVFAIFQVLAIALGALLLRSQVAGM
jgi:Zn-dependent protease/uncharacterized Zn finger protein (UPF0148 family)